MSSPQPLTPSQTMRKLLRYTFAMVFAPWVTYKACYGYVIPVVASHMSGVVFQDESNVAVASGVAAVVAVNVVLAAYVISALREENTFGRFGEKRD
jgi:hypothetical protein|mmetsp:Transcript_5675/g.21498  ORF Transcript_5675/g.21498 Transcript_5675/m.21498 type:complete len:96 (+) Transcript_5675:2784-3071(+)